MAANLALGTYGLEFGFVAIASFPELPLQESLPATFRESASVSELTRRGNEAFNGR